MTEQKSKIELEQIENQSAGIQQTLAGMASEKMLGKEININKLLRVIDETKNMLKNLNFLADQEGVRDNQDQDPARGFEKIISGEWDNQDEGGIPSTHFE